MAERLAVRHGLSPRKARVAGVLHDIARAWNGNDLLAYARAHGLPVSAEAQVAPVLLHAAIGADIARRELGIDDPEIAGAIAHHTVAVPNMSALEKVLYLADTMEPSRSFEGRAHLEVLSFQSLDAAMLESVKESLRYLMARQVPIALETIELYNDMVKQAVKRDGVAS